ncbi:MAG TPA: tetratricopeptide repeat protein [Candidatus Binatia bacterium]|jgi:putative thioredoxin|nr:tetratricopeptide repeat protein [Candidatus Binatia bacterium]
MNDWTIEAGEDNFEADVLERSHEVPVLVDFWAPWCGPCRVLGPVLEKLADEYSGKFVLAKINVDESPSLAGAFGVQGIPAVKLIKDGEIAGEFTGALPEPAVREMLSRYLPSEYDEQADEAADLEEQGKPAEAQAIYQSILDAEPTHAKSLLGLGRVLMNAGDRDDALKNLERISPAAEERKIADRLIARLQLQGDQSADEATLRQKLAAQPDSLEARFELAQALAANEKFEEALSEFLDIVKSDREFRDDGARKAMVQIFDVLPPDDPLIDKYRSELAKVLFR